MDRQNFAYVAARQRAEYICMNINLALQERVLNIEVGTDAKVLKLQENKCKVKHKLKC